MTKRYTTKRRWLIEAARELEPDFADGIEGPGKFDGAGDRELAAALLTLAGVSGQDEEAGSVETGAWLGRFGHYVLSEDSQGFAAVARYGSDRLAAAELEALEAELEAAGDGEVS